MTSNQRERQLQKHGRAVSLSSLENKPARQREALTGKARNNVEATSFTGMLNTCLIHHTKGLTRKAKLDVQQMVQRLNEVAPFLTPLEGAAYAPVLTTPEGTTRTVGEALEVAARNVRRAVATGQVASAKAFLYSMKHLAWRPAHEPV